MDKAKSSMAQQNAQAEITFDQRRTGNQTPKSVSVVLSEGALVSMLHDALSPAEKELAKTPAGAAQMQEFHRQLFAGSSEPTPHRPSQVPPAPRVPRRRIVLTTFGSLGDLHPYLAIALGLQERGHEVVLATSACYREKVESLGVGFRAVRPDQQDWLARRDEARRVMDLHRGTEYVLRTLLLPALRDSYDDLLTAADGADLLVSHPLTYAARLVVETKGLRWASTMLSPIGFFSAHDPPALPGAPFVSWLRFLGPPLYKNLFRVLKLAGRSWARPWYRLRAEVGLPPTRDNPLFDGQHSPALVLALFSELLGARQPDWPAPTLVAGFVFYDRDGAGGLSPELARFLDAGPPPIVFTLGSAAVHDAGPFYEQSAVAARLLDRRAVLLVGRQTHNRPAVLPEGVAAFDYAPFSELFPRAAVIVHQGGVGTTGQAMRGPSDVSSALRLRPAGQRRARGTAGDRPHPGPKPLHRGPRRAGSAAAARRPVVRGAGGRGRPARAPGGRRPRRLRRAGGVAHGPSTRLTLPSSSRGRPGGPDVHVLHHGARGGRRVLQDRRLETAHDRVQSDRGRRPAGRNCSVHSYDRR